MRKLITGMKVSLDGKIEGAEGMADWVQAWSEDYGLMPQLDACVLGAGMYPGYERYWTAIQNEPDKPVWITGSAPTPAEIDWARFVARTPHYVLSSTLASAAWPNTRFIRSLGEIADLKKRPGKDIYLIGGARTAASLIDAGLVDELRLLIYPLIAGTGKALFAMADRRRGLALRKTQQLPDGRVSLIYAIDTTKKPSRQVLAGDARWCAHVGVVGTHLVLQLDRALLQHGDGLAQRQAGRGRDPDLRIAAARRRLALDTVELGRLAVDGLAAHARAAVLALGHGLPGIVRRLRGVVGPRHPLAARLHVERVAETDHLVLHGLARCGGAFDRDLLMDGHGRLLEDRLQHGLARRVVGAGWRPRGAKGSGSEQGNGQQPGSDHAAVLSV